MDNEKITLQILFENNKKEMFSEEIIDVLLKNRGLKTSQQKKEFLDPVLPEKISLNELGIEKQEVEKSIERLKKAFQKKERVIIYGDYDADGICATAILWETLYKSGFDVLPYIPERFSEGYGINFESVKKIKSENPDLGVLITVDNGIVAGKEIKKINDLGIDVIVTDHHQKGKEKLNSFSAIHTTEITGSALSWIFSREILKKIKKEKINDDGLELVAIGTIADQVPLTRQNRSFAKWGLKKLNETKRPGLLSLFQEARLEIGEIGAYEVGFIIAPRINATGRIEHGIDSLRILCTKNTKRSLKLANILGKTNQERQRIVDKVVRRAVEISGKSFIEKVLIIDDSSFHEGVIGLAASKLVEVFYKPAIVISKGKKVSKASARSISGFNIIENIRKLDNLILEGGGHTMAAGFSILTSNIDEFKKKFIEISEKEIDEEMLSRKIKIDMDLNFGDIDLNLIDKIKELEPFGIGNPSPVFITKGVNLKDARLVGKENKHLKMVVEKNERIMDTIGFYMGDFFTKLSKGKKIDIVYSLEKNLWDGREKVQLKLKNIN